MSATSGSLLDVRVPGGSRRRGSRFFLWAGVAVALVVLVGFTKSYFDRVALGLTTLTPLVHVHAAVMAGWFALFIAQATLVAVGRVDLHRKLGVAGIAMAAALLVTCMMVTWHAASAEVIENKSVLFRLILGFNTLSLVVFVSLFAAAIALRTRPEYHKRLMLMASVSLLGPPLGRLIENPYLIIATQSALIVLCVTIDSVRNRRLHPAFAWGGLPIIAIYFWGVWAVQTRTWIEFATRLVS